MKGYIRQRSKGKWEITIDIGRDPSINKRLRHFETIVGGKKDAQHRLAELLLNIEKGTFIKQPKQLTVAAWLRQWLDSYVASNLSPKTKQSYEQELRCYIIPDLGGTRLTELRPHHIQNYISKALSEGRRHRIGGLSSRTVQYHYRILSKSLDDAIRMGLIAVNACKGVSPPRPGRKDIPSIGLEDVTQLISAIKGSSYYLFYHTLLLTGLRRSELLALKWKNLDIDLACIYVAHSLHRLDDGTIIIKEPKTSRSRRPVDLPPSLAILLRQHKVEREEEHIILGKALTDDDFVFSHADGTPLNPNTVSHTFSKIVARAGLCHLRLHDLRHTYATLQRKAGQPVEVISRVLGHASEMVALTVYNHWEGDLRAPADTMDLM